MLIETLSVPLFKAFAQGNKSGSSFTIPQPQGLAPTGDGVWPAGSEGQFAPNRIFILPYAYATQGAVFTTRVYGWRSIDSVPGSRSVFVPFPLIDLTCTVGNIQGVGRDYQILDSEQFCDGLSLAGGAVGKYGEIVTYGAGSGLASFCLVDLRGCRRFSFDFKTSSGATMNALWARA